MMAAPVSSPIEKIGFFHFGGDNRSDPMGSFMEALDRATAGKQTSAGSLIVLPEAFNILDDYYIRSNPDPSIACALGRVSTDRGIVFVAGLIGAPVNDRPGYSYSYLIDYGICRSLSCKTDLDSSNNYTRCPEGCDQAAVHRGLCIASLICHDAAENVEPATICDQVADAEVLLKKKRTRHEELVNQINNRKGKAPSVLCIPSRMDQLSTEGVARYWIANGADIVIISNATRAYPSVIRFGAWSDPVSDSDKSQNLVRLYSWAELKCRKTESESL
jgi:hypothetical protein